MAQFVAVRSLTNRTRIRVRSAYGEVQRVTVNATGGQFRLTYSGQQTADLAFNATAAQVQAALVALSNIGPADVFVTGGPGNAGGTTPYIVNFLVGGALGNNPAQLTGQNGTTPLSGGASTVTVTTVDSTSGGQWTVLSSTADTIIDVDNVENRRALARHSSIGQWVVSGLNNKVNGNVSLPADT